MAMRLGFLSFKDAVISTWEGHVVVKWIAQHVLTLQADSSLLAPVGFLSSGST